MSESILKSVQAEFAKAKREATKAKLKTLYGEYVTAQAVVTGIEQKIVVLLEESGETVESIQALLSE